MARNPLTPFRTGGLMGGDPFLSLHREMNRLFDDVLRGSPTAGGGQGLASSVIAPHINVSETDKEIRVTAELPGVNENDVQVDLDDDVLVIRGEKKFERSDEKENFHFVERAYGTFQRTLQLPFAVDPDQVQASFENGVLTVTLPKSAQQARSRRIQVQGGGKRQSGSQSGVAAQGGPETKGHEGGKSRSAAGEGKG